MLYKVLCSSARAMLAVWRLAPDCCPARSHACSQQRPPTAVRSGWTFVKANGPLQGNKLRFKLIDTPPKRAVAGRPVTRPCVGHRCSTVDADPRAVLRVRAVKAQRCLKACLTTCTLIFSMGTLACSKVDSLRCAASGRIAISRLDADDGASCLPLIGTVDLSVAAFAPARRHAAL